MIPFRQLYRQVARQVFQPWRPARVVQRALHTAQNKTAFPCSLQYADDGLTPYLSLTHQDRTLQFRLQTSKPVSLLLESIKEELGVTHASVGTDRIRWARSTPLEDVLSSAYSQHEGDETKEYDTGKLVLYLDNTVAAPQSRPTSDMASQAQLTELRVALPSYQTRTAALNQEFTKLKSELAALQSQKDYFDSLATKTATKIAWFGLFGLCAQWGLMARLTWWEYSWDVMEPISYFITFGTGILGYMFYTVTRREMSWEQLGSMTITRKQMQLYKKHGFDIKRYELLSRETRSLQERLDTIRNQYGGVKLHGVIPN